MELLHSQAPIQHCNALRHLALVLYRAGPTRFLPGNRFDQYKNENLCNFNFFCLLGYTLFGDSPWHSRVCPPEVPVS